MRAALVACLVKAKESWRGHGASGRETLDNVLNVMATNNSVVVLALGMLRVRVYKESSLYGQRSAKILADVMPK